MGWTLTVSSSSPHRTYHYAIVCKVFMGWAFYFSPQYQSLIASRKQACLGNVRLLCNCRFSTKTSASSIMAQLTLVRFRVSYYFLDGEHFSSRCDVIQGDTTAGLFARLLGTIFGVFVGAVIWSESHVSIGPTVAHRHACRYISTGVGRGNPYGLAVACGVLFPFMIFGRLYWPGPPMTNILFFVTAMLVSIPRTAPVE